MLLAVITGLKKILRPYGRLLGYFKFLLFKFILGPSTEKVGLKSQKHFREKL